MISRRKLLTGAAGLAVAAPASAIAVALPAPAFVGPLTATDLAAREMTFVEMFEGSRDAQLRAIVKIIAETNEILESMKWKD